MDAAPGVCPMCTHDLEVTRLHCRNCNTALEGRFVLNRFAQLSDEQLAFVELFVQLEGKLNRLGQELDLSYPAVRARLTEVVEAFGDLEHEPEVRITISAEKRMDILAMVENGTISAETAAELLKR